MAGREIAMESNLRTTFEMHTLLLCADVQFLGTTRGVLNQFRVTPKIVGACDEAQALIQTQEFAVIIVDWREINNLGEFLTAVHKSKLNHECVLVAIVRDLLDLRQAFAAGVHFLIHKPASVVQIERCLRAAYCATVARRRKQHRERVNVVAAVSTRVQPDAEAWIVNVSEGGVGLRQGSHSGKAAASLNAGEEVELRFVLPGTDNPLHTTGTVVWTTPDYAGVRFTYISEQERLLLEHWLTACVERSLAELCERVRAVCA
jgi:ActR/RegA family two-component response regulator